jgi:hypothetical protein
MGAFMDKKKVLGKGFNNALTVGLGLPAIIFPMVALSTTVMTEFAAFIGMATIGAVY